MRTKTLCVQKITMLVREFQRPFVLSTLTHIRALNSIRYRCDDIEPRDCILTENRSKYRGPVLKTVQVVVVARYLNLVRSFLLIGERTKWPRRDAWVVEGSVSRCERCAFDTKLAERAEVFLTRSSWPRLECNQKNRTLRNRNCF